MNKLLFLILLIGIVATFGVEIGKVSAEDSSVYECGGSASCTGILTADCYEDCADWEYPYTDCGTLSSVCECNCDDTQSCIDNYCVEGGHTFGKCLSDILWSCVDCENCCEDSDYRLWLLGEEGAHSCATQSDCKTISSYREFCSHGCEAGKCIIPPGDCTLGGCSVTCGSDNDNCGKGYSDGCDLLLHYDTNDDGKIWFSEDQVARNDCKAGSIVKEERDFVNSAYSASEMEINNVLGCSSCYTAPTKTCTEKGGTCCPGGKVCTSGKITGASDCTECCGSVANCETGAPSGTGITFKNPLTYDKFEDLVDGIVNFIFTISIVIVPLAIVIGAFFLLISGGDPKKIETGKKIILYALIGLAIVLFAKGLIAMIESILNVKVGG